MKNINEGSIVQFKDPFPDEDIDQLYVVLELMKGEDGDRCKIKALGTGLKFPLISIVDTMDLIIAKVDNSDLIGHLVSIETVEGKRVTGEVVKIWNNKSIAELTKVKDGVDTNLYITIEDRSGKRFDGFLFISPKNHS